MLLILLFSFLTLGLLTILIYHKKERYRILGEIGKVYNDTREIIYNDLEETEIRPKKSKTRYSEKTSDSSGSKKIGLGILRTITKKREE
jgi:hypothetical protein